MSQGQNAGIQRSLALNFRDLSSGEATFACSGIDGTFGWGLPFSSP